MLLFCPVRYKLIYVERNRSVFINSDRFFLFILTTGPPELIICKFWKVIIYITEDKVSTCDFLTCLLNYGLKS